MLTIKIDDVVLEGRLQERLDQYRESYPAMTNDELVVLLLRYHWDIPDDPEEDRTVTDFLTGRID